MGKESTSKAGDTGNVGSTSGSGRSPEGGHGNLILQDSCLENSIDRGAWRAAVHRITESDTTEATERTHGCICIYMFRKEHAYVCMTESPCFTSETNTAL